MAETTPKKHRLNEALEKNKWVKGVSGNPAGRPEGSVSIVDGIKRKLMEIEPENKKTYLELFLNSYFRKAIKDKDSQLMRDLVNRIDGMPKQSIDATTNGQNLSTISMSDFIALIQVNDDNQGKTTDTATEPKKVD